jgi:hypothetical protein
MSNQEENAGFAHALISRAALLVIVAAVVLSPGGASGQSSHSHMSEALRSTFKKVVVLPTRGPVDQAVTGSYQKSTPGLLDGAQAGSEIGTVSKEIAGIPVGIPIPMLTLPGALLGGLTGGAQREIQDFRDALTADLAKAASLTVANEALATDVFWGLRNLPNLDAKIFLLTTPIPGDTDAILYVSLTGITIDVNGKMANITTSAHATLHRLSDSTIVYEKVVEYQDTDTLSNWTKNENLAWHDYATFARHYIGREISAEVFEGIDLRHELTPQESDTVNKVKKNDWQGITRSTTPTLAWELKLLGGDTYGPWAEAIEHVDISYDVDIYDMHRLVYSARQVPDPRHTVEFELECRTYRWTVRPAYQVGNDVKFGAWMRFKSDTGTGNGNVGNKASEAPAYIQDLASLKIKC